MAGLYWIDDNNVKHPVRGGATHGVSSVNGQTGAVSGIAEQADVDALEETVSQQSSAIAALQNEVSGINTLLGSGVIE